MIKVYKNGKRPDGMSLIPWSHGRPLVWDATCVDTLAASHLPITSRGAGAAVAESNKRRKYICLGDGYIFLPFGVETLGSWGPEARLLFKEISKRLIDKTNDKRAGAYLGQRLSIAIQRGLPRVLAWQTVFANKYRDYENAEKIPSRLLALMRTYYEDASQRIADLNPLRFMYEESPHFETGYVIYEMIERYKKMVEHLDRMTKFKPSVMENVDHTETMQKLYFEIYHIVKMIHEIPRKWSHVEEFRIRKKGEAPPVEMNEEAMKNAEKWKRREQRKRLKLLKKRREMIRKGMITNTERPKITFPKPFPLEYGWDIAEW